MVSLFAKVAPNARPSRARVELHQISRLDLQRLCDPVDVQQADIALPALDAPDVGSVQLGLERQVLLGQAAQLAFKAAMFEAISVPTCCPNGTTRVHSVRLGKEEIGKVAFQALADQLERVETDVLLVHLDSVQSRLRYSQLSGEVSLRRIAPHSLDVRRLSLLKTSSSRWRKDLGR